MGKGGTLVGTGGNQWGLRTALAIGAVEVSVLCISILSISFFLKECFSLLQLYRYAYKL